MRGDPMHLQSTRCENAGVLSTVIAVVEMQWKWGWHHMLDNRGVLSRLERNVEWGDDSKREIDAAGEVRSWVNQVDVDIGYELEAWMSRLTGDPKLEWRRGHPERRQRDRTKWSDEEWCMYEVDDIAEQQYERYRDVADRWDAWEFSHRAPYQVKWRGNVLNGDVRKLLMKAVKEERLMEAMVNKRANTAVKGILRRQEESQEAGGLGEEGGTRINKAEIKRREGAREIF